MEGEKEGGEMEVGKALPEDAGEVGHSGTGGVAGCDGCI